MRISVLAALLLPSLIACSPRPEVEVEEPPIRYEVRIDLAEGSSAVYCDGDLVGNTPVALSLEAGEHSLRFTRQEYADQTAAMRVDRRAERVFRHQREASRWRSRAAYRTGRQPKQVSFTPDDRYLVVTLLDDDGFDLIDLERDGETMRVTPGLYGERRGFVESLMCPEKGSFWISQMTTGLLFEYELPRPDGSPPRLLRVLSAHGEWTKVIAADAEYRYLAAANWISGTVSILDYGTGRLLASVSGFRAPRGLAFSPDGAFLYVCSYEGGSFVKLKTGTWERVSSYVEPSSAPRHIVLSDKGDIAYVSDMHLRRVLRFDTDTVAMTGTYRVDRNPNTIKLSADGRRLFVSCRGRNNDQSYLLRSPEDGTVQIFDLPSGTREAVLRGGNQPTGLDVSKDGRLLAFTSFLDDRVELYELADSPVGY